MGKLTSVEWFAIELYERFEMRGDGREMNDLLEKANELHRQEIITANRDGVDMVIDKKDFISGEDYYDKTFKN